MDFSDRQARFFGFYAIALVLTSFGWFIGLSLALGGNLVQGRSMWDETATAMHGALGGAIVATLISGFVIYRNRRDRRAQLPESAET